MPPAVKEGNGADTLEISGILIPAAEEKEEKESVRVGHGARGDNGAMTRGRSISQRRTCDEVSKKEEDNLIYLCQIFSVL